MKKDIVKVRVEGHYSAEFRDDGETGPRVDVWRGVEWFGQWKWGGETFGERIAGNRRPTPAAMVDLASALRQKGVSA